jgi:hypothetical protein
LGAFGEGDAGDHDVSAGGELSAEEGIHGLDGDVGPAGVDGGLGVMHEGCSGIAVDVGWGQATSAGG